VIDRNSIRSNWSRLGSVRAQLVADVSGLPFIAIVPILMYRNMAPDQILWLSMAFKINSFVSGAVGSSCYSYHLMELTKSQPSSQWVRSAALNAALYAAPTATFAAIATASAARVPAVSLAVPSVVLATATSFLAAVVGALRFCLRPLMVFVIENSLLFLGPVTAILLFHSALAVSFSVATVAGAVSRWPWGNDSTKRSPKRIVPPALLLHKFAQISCSSVPMLVGLAVVGRADTSGASQLAAATSLALIPLLLASSSSGIVARRTNEGKKPEVTPRALFVVSVSVSIFLCLFALPILNFFVDSTIDSSKYRIAIYSILLFSAPQAIMNNRRSVLDGAGRPRAHTRLAALFTVASTGTGLVVQWFNSPALYFVGATFAALVISAAILLGSKHPDGSSFE
jgi:hypothetical protein